MLTLAVFVGPANAMALQVKPPTSTSWYMNFYSTDSDAALNSQMFARGYELGQRDLGLPGAQNSIAVLDFGQPWVQNGVYGTIGFSGYYRFASVSTIRLAAAWFAYGYINGAGSDTLSVVRMVIGTNNYGSYATSAHGQAWAQMMRNIGADITTYGWSNRIGVRAGNDMEPSYSTPSGTANWVNGYAGAWASPYFLYNYGSADGCPTSGATSAPKACSNGWSQDTVWFVSWGAAPSYPLPEVYSTGGGNAKQWQQISLYSALGRGGRMSIAGPLSESQGCAQRGGCSGIDNTSDAAWTQLWTELNNNSLTAQSMSWSTDIKWNH